MPLKVSLAVDFSVGIMSFELPVPKDELRKVVMNGDSSSRSLDEVLSRKQISVEGDKIFCTKDTYQKLVAQIIKFYSKPNHGKVVRQEMSRSNQVNRIGQAFGVSENIDAQRTEEFKRVISSNCVVEQPQKCFQLLRIRSHLFKLIMAPYIHNIITERVENFLEYKSEEKAGLDGSSFFDQILRNEFKLVHNKTIFCLGMQICWNHVQKTISFRADHGRSLLQNF